MRLGQAKLIISFSSYVQEFPQAGGWLFILFFVMNIIKYHHEFHKKNGRVYDVMPCGLFNDSFNDIHELKCGQAEEKLEAGGDEKLIFNFIWP